LRVGISLNPEVDGAKLNINSIRTVFPKDMSEWANWISQDKALYIDKEKVSDLLANPRNPEDVTNNPTLIKKLQEFKKPPSNIGRVRSPAPVGGVAIPTIYEERLPR